jgi:hypothetical protein
LQKRESITERVKDRFKTDSYILIFISSAQRLMRAYPRLTVMENAMEVMTRSICSFLIKAAVIAKMAIMVKWHLICFTYL